MQILSFIRGNHYLFVNFSDIFNIQGMTEFTYCFKPCVFNLNKVYKLVLDYAINRLFTGMKSRTFIAEMNEMSPFIGSNKYLINLYSQPYT